MVGPPARTMSRVLVGLFVAIVGSAADCIPAPQRSYSDEQPAEIHKRAERGYQEQQIELAAAYLIGRGVTQDYALAAKWYEKAAGTGSPEAQIQIGYLYEYGIGVRADADRALRWFQLASASGLPLAKVNVGVCYLKGLGVRENASTAKELFLQAASKGSGLGAAYLGLMEYFGLGTPIDKSGAEKWFALGERLNDPIAGYILASLYAKGEGSAHDQRRIFKLLRSSSKGGYVAAKHTLGLLLLKHPDMVESDHEPRILLEEASNAGNWRSSAALAMMARDGMTMETDVSQAYYYFHLAGLQGGPAARQLLERDFRNLSQRVSKQEQKALAARADAWFRQHRVPLIFVLNDSFSGQNFPVVAGTQPYSLE